MPDFLHDLLTEPLLSIRLADGMRQRLSLPALFVALGDDRVEDFPRLRPHQSHAWHAFLVQSAALALQAGGGSWPESEDAWRQALLSLSGEEPAAWALVVADLAKPALLQPPVSEGDLRAFKRTLPTPDALDVLITAKNHDLKMERMVRPQPEHWVYALVTLQTTDGYLGAGNYGIARMNGGLASRPCVSYTPGVRWGPRFKRDVEALREAREAIVAEHDLAASGGLGLLWLAPWDGTASLAWEGCDPFFIEICRRIRLVADSGDALSARMATSKVERLDAKARKGNTGDPWTPILKSEAKALTVSGGGFTYDLLQLLMFSGDVLRGAAQAPRSVERGDALDFYAAVLVRGQGKTEGWHERRLPLPKNVRKLIRNPDARVSLGQVAKVRVEEAKSLRNAVLKPALCKFLQVRAERIDLSAPGPRPWLEAFDAGVDRFFFDALWERAELESDPVQADEAWRGRLRELARRCFEAGVAELPIPEQSRLRAEAEATSMFESLLKRHAPKPDPTQPTRSPV